MYLSDSGSHSSAKCHKTKYLNLISDIKHSGIIFSIKASLGLIAPKQEEVQDYNFMTCATQRKKKRIFFTYSDVVKANHLPTCCTSLPHEVRGWIGEDASSPSEDPPCLTGNERKDRSCNKSPHHSLGRKFPKLLSQRIQGFIPERIQKSDSWALWGMTAAWPP